MNVIISDFENYLTQEAVSYIKRARLRLVSSSNATSWANLTTLDKEAQADGNVSITVNIPYSVYSGKTITQIKLQGQANDDCITHNVRISRSAGAEDEIKYQFQFRIRAVG